MGRLETPLQFRINFIHELFRGKIRVVSTYPIKVLQFFAGYFSRHAPRPIATDLWRHFAGGSNFSILGPIWFRLRRVRVA